MIARCFSLFLLIFLLTSCKKDSPKVPLIEVDGKTGMLAAVNKLREAGCKCGQDTMPPAPLLRWNDTLAIAANVHAKDMFYNNYFSHTDPDGSVPIQRAKAVGYTGGSVLENIANGYNSLTDVILAWKNSEDHCKSMMDSSYKEMGAARANEYWVQEFGKP
ncbi:CAP domain-containing protein [Mucilaginibacter lappiensis]|uniref:Uncharacterized protein YkwD n=1 Tax=Mucilaginibacter lappiensis TaxID=354630 RepID=A0A841JNG2_9SPHI|nr:CAP domain-containing protein [Mucilaginibacter lappiensis]MBB6131146.1 uncharacterized protein YkwD [Mucilaginibacter lappiensis]